MLGEAEGGGEVSPSCGGGGCAGQTFVPCLLRCVSLSLFGLTSLDIKSPSGFEHTGPICQPGSILDWMSISRFKVGRFAPVALCVCVCVPLKYNAHTCLIFNPPPLL